MNTESLLQKLGDSFGSYTVGPSGFIRCERAFGNKARSVYFFKHTESIPSDDELAKIQHEVVSPSYFNAQDSSRWSHYLVFLADDSSNKVPDFAPRKRKIEDDKSYARKLVLLESELENFLDHKVPIASPDQQGQPLVNTWGQKLAEAGLEDVQSDIARAPIVRDIRAGLTKPASYTAPNELDKPSNRPAAPRFIKTLTIKRFGNRKLSGTFNFGRVNLIRGSNGSGKTSLLEAIEHFVCGATFRSHGKAEIFDATMTQANGKPALVYKEQDNATYKKTDLLWYGRSIPKNNKLYEGFAQFNFLNTDAAVHFSDDSNLRDLREVLSKIALGPTAAYTWDRINQFHDHIEAELPPIRSRLSARVQNLSNAKDRLASLQVSSPQFEVLRDLVNEALSALDWPPMPLFDGEPSADWFKSFTPLQRFIEIYPESGAKSQGDLAKRVETIHQDLQNFEELEIKGRETSDSQDNLIRTRKAHEEVGSRVRRWSQYITCGFAGLCGERDQIESERLHLLRKQISALDIEVIRIVSNDLNCLQVPLATFREKLSTALESTRKEAEAADRSRAVLERRVQNAQVLVAEIHALGRKYAHDVAIASECPLCRTLMDMEDLLKRIEESSGKDAASAQLEATLQISSYHHSSMRLLIDASQIVEQLSKDVYLDQSISVEKIIRSINFDQNSLTALDQKLVGISTQFDQLRASGFNDEEYLDLTAQIRDDQLLAEIVLSGKSEALSGFLNNHELQLENLTAAINEIRKSLDSISSRKSEVLKRYATPDGRVADTKEPLLNAVAAGLNVMAILEAMPTSTSQKFREDLSGLDKLAQEAINAIDRLSLQIQGERSKNGEMATLQKQIAEEDEKYRTENDECNRLKAALTVLGNIRNNHSLESGMEKFFSNNLSVIQKIFSKIHVPNELELFDLANCKLKRSGFDELVDLNQVSTGQRAALMLSIFLTLNLSLRAAPPFTLIDDPIAHIDDLNALSFLDFLADIAESGQRQIFFATANEKLANLFEKKMQFLGDDFIALNM